MTPDRKGSPSSGEDPDSRNPADERRRMPLALRERAQDRDRKARRESRYRQAVVGGMAASVLLHVLILAVISLNLPSPMAEREDPDEDRPLPLEGMEVVQVDPTPPPPPDPLPEEPEPEVMDEPLEEVAEPFDPEEAVPVPVPEERALTNAERLRPREGDGRIWETFGLEDLPEADRPLTFRADSAVRVILRDWLDSLQLEEEAYRAARDWTFGSGDKRFGISSEGLHLGDITIPLPVGELLQPPGPLRRQIEREMRELQAIQRQDLLGDAEAVREERIEAMRERSREEAAARSEESAAESDTTANDDPDS